MFGGVNVHKRNKMKGNEHFFVGETGVLRVGSGWFGGGSWSFACASAGFCMCFWGKKLRFKKKCWILAFGNWVCFFI